MAFKKFRKMKVYNVSGYNYKDTPTIILKGDWLKETGFGIGSLIQVECENDLLLPGTARGSGKRRCSD